MAGLVIGVRSMLLLLCGSEENSNTRFIHHPKSPKNHEYILATQQNRLYQGHEDFESSPSSMTGVTTPKSSTAKEAKLLPDKPARRICVTNPTASDSMTVTTVSYNVSDVSVRKGRSTKTRKETCKVPPFWRRRRRRRRSLRVCWSNSLCVRVPKRLVRCLAQPVVRATCSSSFKRKG